MYVKNEYRSKGIAYNLINHLIKHASNKLSILQLSVNVKNIKAIQLYEKLGFDVYGTEVKAIKFNNEYIDEYLMSLELKNYG